MNCPQCGDVCRCLPEPAPAVSTRWMADVAMQNASAILPASVKVVDASLIDSEVRAGEANALQENSRPKSEVPAGEGAAWRDELSERLDRYRARRKPRPPRYPSLRLRFDTPLHSAAADSTLQPVPEFETASNQA